MTTPLYLYDSYLKEVDVIILEIVKENDRRWQMVFDQTLFYPIGGGQPTDQGIVCTDNWTGKVTLALQKEGKIIHYIESEQPPSVGTLVREKLDWERRYRHMRLHSGGHIVDFALYLLGYSPSYLTPLKGDHGKKPVICYQGVIDKDIREDLEKKANELVLQNHSFSFHLAGHEELETKAIYLQPGLPKNKPLRLLTLNGVGSVADGGTQVNSTSEVGKISIPSIETKEGMTYIHYRLE